VFADTDTFSQQQMLRYLINGARQTMIAIWRADLMI
jgi:hypothetical protein